MRVQWGKAWLVAVFWLVLVMALPLPGWAGANSAWPGGWRLPIYAASAQTSLETQILGEKTPQPPRTGAALLQEMAPSLQLHPDGTTLKLPYNLEMNISVHYSQETPARESQLRSDSPLLMKYTMDYRLLPNLQVGLNSYLYRPADDALALQRPGSRLGFGPELKYNLGHWNFLVRSQMESGGKDQGQNKDLQNWFRVWYAF